MFANTYSAPTLELDWLREAMDNLFSGPSGAVHEFPPVNVWANNDGAVIQAELPGISANDLDISVVNDTLTLKGARHAEPLKEGERFLRRERLRGEFTRSLKVPFKIDNNGVSAEFSKGVLTINVPRAESDKPRKIAVQAK